MELSFKTILVFFLALSFRLWDINLLEPQADELHWRFRSRDFIENLLQGNFLRAGKEMTHPGVPAALIMGTGQVIGKKLGYDDILISSRIANAIFSSLIPCLVLICGSFFLGNGAGLLAALFTALSPKLIAFSKMAHIDSTLAFFVLACVFSYIYSLKTKKEFFRYLAGVLWGFAILVKPTAIVLIPGIIILKALFNTERLITIKDFYAILLGKIIFVALFSRMWTPHSPYRNRIVPHFNFGEAIFSFGNLISPYAILFFLLTIGFLVYRNTRWYTFIPAILTVHALNPSILDNISRFWAWAFGIAKISHEAYGVSFEPVKYGYLQILGTQLGEIELFGFALGLFLLRKNHVIQGIFFISLIWVGLISVSGKQTVRYLAPILPFISIIAASGYWELFRRFSFYLIIPILVQLYLWFPYYESYYNFISGGIKAAKERGEFIPLGGYSETIRYLKDKGSISLAADMELFKEIQKRENIHFPFSIYPIMNGDTRLVVSPTFETVFKENLNTENLELEKEIKIFDVTAFKVFRILPNTYVNLRRAATLAGNFCAEGICSRGQNGFLIAILKPRLRSGDYLLTIKVKGKKNKVEGDPTLLHLKFGSGCERYIKNSELPQNESVQFTINCSFKEESVPNITVYHWAKRKVVIEDFSIQSLTS